MKKIYSFILLFLLSIFLIGCEKEQDLTKIYENDIYYTLFVRSFADSDGDGIGDLNGVTENLDYLEELGITGIWLLPIFATADGWHNNHGYATTDYLKINEDYGTIADLENLLIEAKKRDINVILDLVINHTSNQHPWYLDAKSNINSPYRDYYIWTSENTALQTFVGGMVDLNLNNPKVKAEIFNIVDHYLDLGVAGFRVDAVKHFFDPPKQGSPAIFMLELYTHIRAKKADAFLVGEVFDYYYEFVAPYFVSQASYFNFYLSKEIQDKVGFGSSTKSFSKNLERMYDELKSKKHDFLDSPFLTNHDLDRLASRGEYVSLETRKLAVNFLLTLPGNPFIYYGEELDMKGKRYEGEVIGGQIAYDEYRRQPYIWGNEYQTTWLPSDGSNDKTPSYLEQKVDENSMYNHYKKMIALRKAIPALMYGNEFYAYQDSTFDLQGYLRVIDDENLQEAVLVLHNISSKEINVDFDFKFLYGEKVIPPYGTVVIEIPFNRIEDFK